jgi:hypothetical protein
MSLPPNTSGPPESPWQVSTPPCGKPAHTMEVLLYCGYAVLHVASEVSGTLALSRYREAEPPEDVVPQPRISAELPAAYRAVSAGVASGRVAELMLRSSVSTATS